MVKLNRVIATHYPEGNVDYPEAIKSVIALYFSYHGAYFKLNNPDAVRLAGEIELMGRTFAQRQAIEVAEATGKPPRGKIVIP